MVTPATVRWPRVLTPSHMIQIIKQQKNPLSAIHVFNAATSLYPSSVYSHTPSVYTALISSLPSSSISLPFLRHVAESPSPSADVALSSIVPSLPSPLLSFLLRFPLLPLSFNSALSTLLSRNDFLSARQLLDEIPDSTPLSLSSLNLIILSLCRLGRPDLALSTFTDLNHQCYFPDRDSYRMLMCGLCDANLLDDATHLLYSMLWRVSKKGCEGDIVVYRTLLHSLCDAGKTRDAGELLAKCLMKGLRSNSTRRGFRKLELDVDDVEIQKRKIDIALVGRGVRSLKSYAAMIIDLYREGEIGSADKVFDEMIERGFKPSLAIYEARIRALCKDGRAEEAVRVVKVDMKMRSCIPKVSTYEIIMEAFCEETKSTKAVKLWEKMEKQVGCVARKETFEILVNGLLTEGLFLEAHSVLETMAKRKYWACSEIYDKVIDGLCGLGRKYEATLWFEEMMSQGKIARSSTWRALVSLLCLDHDHPEPILFLDNLIS